MKRIMIFIALAVINVNIFSQELNLNDQTKDFFLQKSKNQNKTGWILLGTGTAMIIGGATVFNNSWDSGSATTTDISGFVILGGVIADLACIPVFISAGRNKRRAASMTLTYQNILLKPDYMFHMTAAPSLSVKINF
jgi:hypothetical protein